jgi:hypothetical protein
MGMDTTTEPAAPAEQSAELATDFSSETPTDMSMDTTADPAADPAAEAPAQETGGENADEPILKTVQKLTGKITQKMREGAQELESKDYKYVVNSILSAIDMTKMTEEDMNDILNKLQNKDSEDTANAEPAVETPAPEEQPVQEQPRRFQKSVIDEFLSTLGR